MDSISSNSFMRQIVPQSRSSSSSSLTQKPQEKTKPNLLNLTEVLLTKTLSYLSDKDLVAASLACKTIYKNDKAWKEKLSQKEHPTLASERFKKTGKTDKERSWKAAYLALKRENEGVDVLHPPLIRLRPSMLEYGWYEKSSILSTASSQFNFPNTRGAYQLFFSIGDYLTPGLKDLQQEQRPNYDQFNKRPSDFYKGQPLKMLCGAFSNGVLDARKGRITELDGRVLEGDFSSGQLFGQGTILEKNGRELRGTFDEGRLHTGKISNLFIDLSVNVLNMFIINNKFVSKESFKNLAREYNQNIIGENNNKYNSFATDDGRILRLYDVPSNIAKMLMNVKNIAAIFGAILRALERQYEQITLPDSEGRILKGHIVNGELYGEGRIIEAERELIGIFKNSQLKLGVICTSSSIELVGANTSSSIQTKLALDDEEIESQELVSADTSSSIQTTLSLDNEQIESQKSPSGKRKRSKEESEETTTSSYKKGKAVKDTAISLSSSSSSSSLNQIENPNIFPLKRSYYIEFSRNNYGPYDLTPLNGYHTILTFNGIKLEGNFTDSQLDGYGIMILKEKERILIGDFKKGILHTGYFVSQNKDAPITHIREGKIDFDFVGRNNRIDEAIHNKEIVAKVKSILNEDWLEQIAEEAAEVAAAAESESEEEA